MKIFINYFFSKSDQIRSFLWIWSYLLKKSLMGNFISCAVTSRVLSSLSVLMFMVYLTSNNAAFQLKNSSFWVPDVVIVFWVPDVVLTYNWRTVDRCGRWMLMRWMNYQYQCLEGHRNVYLFNFSHLDDFFLVFSLNCLLMFF